MSTKPLKIKWRQRKNQMEEKGSKRNAKTSYHSFCKVSSSTQAYPCKVIPTKKLRCNNLNPLLPLTKIYLHISKIVKRAASQEKCSKSTSKETQGMLWLQRTGLPCCSLQWLRTCNELENLMRKLRRKLRRISCENLGKYANIWRNKTAATLLSSLLQLLQLVSGPEKWPKIINRAQGDHANKVRQPGL